MSRKQGCDLNNIPVRASIPCLQIVTDKDHAYEQKHPGKKRMTSVQFAELADSDQYKPPDIVDEDELR